MTRPVDLKFAPNGSLMSWLRDAWVMDGNFRPGTGSLLRIRPELARVGHPKAPLIRVSEVTVHGDMDCFRGEDTHGDLRLWQGGAQASPSILDKDGRDWVSYRPGDRARGEYRRLSQVRATDQTLSLAAMATASTRPTTPSPAASPRRRPTTSGLNRRSARWQIGLRLGFLRRPCTMTLLRIDIPTYWFLYEGTPGGKLDPNEDFVHFALMGQELVD